MQLEHARDLARSAFWLIPAICVVAAVGLGIGLLKVDQHLGATRAVFLFPGPPSGARTFLSSIIQAMITFTGLVFSITIVVLQLTSSQFSPRVLRTFVRDRTIQLSLGIFLATFVYAIVILRGVRGSATHGPVVPRAAITVSFALVILSVGMFIRYVTHIANMIRAASIIESLGRESRACLKRHLDSERSGAAQGPVTLGAAAGEVRAIEPGVIVAIDASRLVNLARGVDVQLVMAQRIGEYVPAGATVARLYGPGRLGDEAVLRHITFGGEQTMEQDLAFGFRQLVDIAQRALSPGINDPTTAVQAIDVLHDLLRRLAPRHLSPTCCFDADGVMRVAIPELSFEGYLGLAVGQIWHFGADSVQVPQRLTQMLTDLRDVASTSNLNLIGDWLDTVGPAGQRDPTWGTTLSVSEPPRA
jgi:uncharacterized membrane protein